MLQAIALSNQRTHETRARINQALRGFRRLPFAVRFSIAVALTIGVVAVQHFLVPDLSAALAILVGGAR
jgi:hypothetical protein